MSLSIYPSTIVDADNLNGDDVNVDNLNADNLNGDDVNVDNWNVDNLNADYIDTDNMNIDKMITSNLMLIMRMLIT